MSAFSLVKEPFPESGGDAFYFSTPALTARLAELCAAVQRGHVLLIDEAASGKSTMLDSFVETQSEQWRVFRLQARAHQSAKDFLHDLVSTLGLPIREPAAAELRDVDTLLELLASRSQVAVIVIDDVHRLEPGALGQLLYLARRWQAYGVRFLLCAEPSLTEQLGALDEGGGFPGVVSTLGMPRFEHEEVSDYLHMCLFRAGFVGDSPFDSVSVATLREKAAGLVGAIDAIAREVLKAGGLNRRDDDGGEPGRIGARRWPVALLAVAGLGALLTVAVPGPGVSRTGGEANRQVGVFRSSITLAPRESLQAFRDPSAAADTIAP
jgi:type II secretory pathway predicted ATPase ExeA